MELAMNNWMGKDHRPISEQQAIQIVGSKAELEKMIPAYNQKNRAINCGIISVGRLTSGADLLRTPEGFRLVGSSAEISQVINELTAGKERLLLSQALEAKASRLLAMKRVHSRQRFNRSQSDTR